MQTLELTKPPGLEAASADTDANTTIKATVAKRRRSSRPFRRWRAIDAVLSSAWRGTAVQRIVLVDLIRRCNAGGSCYPNLETIAEAVSVDRTTVARALRRLEQDETCPVVLTRERRRRDGAAKNRSNLYRLALRHSGTVPLSNRRHSGAVHSHSGTVPPDPLIDPLGIYEERDATRGRARPRGRSRPDGSSDRAIAAATTAQSDRGSRVPPAAPAAPHDANAILAAWSPNPDVYAYAEEQRRFSRAEVDRQAELYRNHASTERYAKSAAALDKAFRTWLDSPLCRPAPRPRPRKEAPGPALQQGMVVNSTVDMAALMAEFGPAAKGGAS